MLVLTQLSVGAFVVGLLSDQVEGLLAWQDFRKLHATSALGFGLLALAASTMHLGRPQFAFRAFIGLKHSWLSREIVAFGVFAKTAMVFAAACWFFPDSWALKPLGWAVATSGAVGVFCSAMIYAVTYREFWRLGPTTIKFILTSTILGVAVTWLAIVLFANFMDSPGAKEVVLQVGEILIQTLVVASIAKLLFELSILRNLLHRQQSALKRSAQLLMGPLSSSLFARIACGVLGGVIMPLFLLSALKSSNPESLQQVIPVAMLFVSCLAGEILERYHFFAACSASRMPGRLST